VPLFVGFLVFVVGAIAQYAVGRQLGVPRKANRIAAILFLCTFFLPGWRELPRSWRIPSVLNTHDWLVGLITLWMVSIAVAAVVIFVRSRVRVTDPGRRQFLQAATTALCVAPAATFGFGIITRKDFHVNEVNLKFPNLPKDLNGLRLLQLSDIHLGAFFTPKDLERVIDASNHLRPDLAFITGDLITNRYDPLDTCLQQLKRIRTASGIWGCMGNHEKFSHVESYTQEMAKKLDMQFLRREATNLRFGNGRLNLVGVDFEFSTPYLRDVEELIDLDSFNLLLAHTPEVFPTAAEKGFDLTLSGHTHGGQINVPVLGMNLNIADTRTRYTKGLYSLPTSQIYVNSGLGTIAVPVRLGAPPEITLVRLCAT
jgi:uncharacterized protein